jgi:histidinol-phosphate aminotransferase
MTDMNKYWSNTLKNLSPYQAGEQPQDKSYIKLNTNESPYPPSAKVLDAIKAKVSDRLRLYPDPEATQLRWAIADYYALQMDNIFVGNGSDEVLGFAFQAFFKTDKTVVFPDITYSFYPVYCRLFGIDYKTFPLTETFQIDIDLIDKDCSGVIIANPNAPTGSIVDTEQIETVLKRHSNSVVLIDEAYIDFGGQSCIPLINQYPNLLVVQTLSKSRSLAGLRVGAAFGNAELIEGIKRIKNSFNAYPLDSLAIAGATAAFEDRETFEQNRQLIIRAREWTSRELEKLSFYVVPSKANFVMIRHTHMPAKMLYLTLKDKGILVRYFNSLRIDNFVRVTIGTLEEMQTFIKTLREIL